jgi:hypothetical protein
VDIAKKYGLTSEEFDDYCTLPDPSSKDRVFYPYHVLSRPQAQGWWTWNHVHQIAKYMLYVMRKHCNKHAEAAGHGETEMNPFRLIYWRGASPFPKDPKGEVPAANSGARGDCVPHPGQMGSSSHSMDLHYPQSVSLQRPGPRDCDAVWCVKRKL